MRSRIALAERDEERQRELIDFKMVAFSLGGKDYGIDIMRVKEIAKYAQFTYVPNTSPYVRGVYNLRGDIISIIDLRLMFNVTVPERDPGELEAGLILRLETGLIGVVVDSIDKVIGISSARVQPPHPIFGDINVKYISGVAEYDERLYIILDVDRIFAREDERRTDDSGAFLPALPDAGHAPAPRPLGQLPATSGSAPAKSESDRQVAPEPGRAASSTAGSGRSAMAPETNGERPSSRVSPAAPLTSASAARPASSNAHDAAPAATPPAVQSRAADAVDATDASEMVAEFIAGELNTFTGFTVTPINRRWYDRRVATWLEESSRLEVDPQIGDETTARRFLAPFSSAHTAEFWPAAYIGPRIEPIHLDESSIMHVWNPGCGTGHESYSLAAWLLLGIEDKQLKIWAGDNDLLRISSAPNLSFTREETPEEWESLLVDTKQGVSFDETVRQAVLFEFSDALNSTGLPRLDMIVARDLLSYQSVDDQQRLLERFDELLKPGGLLILGDNEEPLNLDAWDEVAVTGAVVYRHR